MGIYGEIQDKILLGTDPLMEGVSEDPTLVTPDVSEVLESSRALWCHQGVPLCAVMVPTRTNADLFRS